MGIFKRSNKHSLRDVCVELYGEEFGEKYDILASGGTIGGFEETVEFLQKVDAAKRTMSGATGDIGKEQRK